MSFFPDTQGRLTDQVLLDYLVDYLFSLLQERKGGKQSLLIMIFLANMASNQKLKGMLLNNNRFKALLLFFFSSHALFRLDLQMVVSQTLYNLLQKNHQAMGVFSKIDIRLCLEEYQQHLACSLDESTPMEKVRGQMGEMVECLRQK